MPADVLVKQRLQIAPQRALVQHTVLGQLPIIVNDRKPRALTAMAQEDQTVALFMSPATAKNNNNIYCTSAHLHEGGTQPDEVGLNRAVALSLLCPCPYTRRVQLCADGKRVINYARWQRRQAAQLQP